MRWTKLTTAARFLALAGLLVLAACDDGQQAAHQVPPSETGVGGPAAPGTVGGNSTRHGPAKRNGDAAAPAPAPAMPKAPITQSAYDFIDPAVLERPDYGLYTYVLFPNAFLTQRNAELLRALFRTTPGAPSVPLAPHFLNIVYVPVKGGQQAWELLRSPGLAPPEKALAMAAEMYDHDLAGRMLGFFCNGHPGACAQGIGNGPYLLTVARPLSGGASPAVAYLLIDLSPIHPGAFARFVEAMKAQVTRPDFTDRTKVDTVANSLLQIVLTAADWIVPIREGVASILKVGG